MCKQVSLAIGGKLVRLEVDDESFLGLLALESFVVSSDEPDARLSVRIFAEDAFHHAVEERYCNVRAQESILAYSTRATFFDSVHCRMESLGIPPRSPEVLLKSLLGILLSTLAAKDGGFVFHGAGFVLGQAAGAFVGLSGAGKSTAVQLLEPDRILSDDVVVASNDKGLPRLHATPLGRVSDGPGSAPLAALFFPLKQERFSLARVSPREALARCVAEQTHGFRGVFKPYREASFRNLNRLLKIVPCYEMGFSLDGVDRDAIREALVAR
jgi:hypothetical protein